MFAHLNSPIDRCLCLTLQTLVTKNKTDIFELKQLHLLPKHLSWPAVMFPGKKYYIFYFRHMNTIEIKRQAHYRSFCSTLHITVKSVTDRFGITGNLFYTASYLAGKLLYYLQLPFRPWFLRMLTSPSSPFSSSISASFTEEIAGSTSMRPGYKLSTTAISPWSA